jgi:hypothetical protein
MVSGVRNVLARANHSFARLSSLPGHEMYEEYTRWSLYPTGTHVDEERTRILKVNDNYPFMCAMSEAITSDYAKLEAFYFGDCKNTGIGISVKQMCTPLFCSKFTHNRQKSSIPLHNSPRRLERGNAWFYHANGLLCDGISFQNDTIEQVPPLTRITVRFDRNRCLVEFSTDKSIIGNIRGVIGNDLHFFCFTDGKGCWTISSSSQSGIVHILESETCQDWTQSFVHESAPLCNEVAELDSAGNIGPGADISGDDAEKHQHFIPAAPPKPELHHHDYSCQSLFVETMPTSNSSLEFDNSDASNTASVSKLSVGDRTDRLLCDFFSDYGRGHARVTLPAADGEIPVRAAAVSEASEWGRRQRVPAPQEPFPAVGQLFVDCQPIDSDHISFLSCSPIVGDIDAVAVPVTSETIPDPALSLLQCRCRRRGRIPRSGIETNMSAVATQHPSPVVSSAGKESLLVCLDCGRLH